MFWTTEMWLLDGFCVSPKIPRSAEINPTKSLNHFRFSIDNKAKINPTGKMRYFRSSNRYFMSFLDFDFELFRRISMYIIKIIERMKNVNRFKNSYSNGNGAFFSEF